MKRFAGVLTIALISWLVFAMKPAVTAPPEPGPPAIERKSMTHDETGDGSLETRVSTLGAGCFWCVEAVFQELEGVLKVESGYAGGQVESPTYQQICTGTTGHAEVCRITYDPSRLTFDELLEVYWKTHDPTTLNQQGNDKGTQYRSVIFYHDEEQQEKAEKYRKALDESGAYPAPIVTEIVPLEKFYMAEDYHQDYFSLNPSQAYCRFVIEPKMEKFRKVFSSKLKSSK